MPEDLFIQALSMLVDLDLLGAALSECLAELDSVDLGSLAAFAGRNTTVETVAEGPRPVLDEFARYLERGPSMAEVERVELTFGEATGEFSGFNIRY